MTKMTRPLEWLLEQLAEELKLALSTHAPMHSAHEGYAVILEELDELKEEVWKKRSERDLLKMRAEAIQVAAMGIRFAFDICPPPPEDE